MNDDEEIVAIFKAEVEELLGALASAIDQSPSRWNLDSLLHIAHTLKGASRMVGAHSIDALAHLLEGCLSVIEDPTTVDDVIVELIRAGCELLESMTEDLDADRHEDITAYRARLTQFIDPRKLEPTPLAGRDRERGPHMPTHEGALDPAPQTEDDDTATATIRVGTEKVERLMGLASDFLAVGHGLHAQQRGSSAALRAWQTVARQHPELAQRPELRAVSEALGEWKDALDKTARQHERATQEFHDGVRQLRMVRTAALTGIFAKTVRNVGRATGKRARFIVEGGSTEIDRVTLDTLRDPLIHLIRNAVAHGIEDVETRQRAGKLATGTVTLAARSSGASVVLEVSDDGAGLDFERLRRRAVSRGIMSEAAASEASHHLLSELIFNSGFSTEDTVGEISGRGVGLSIVQRNTLSLGGQVAVESQRGVGCKIQLRVPLTRLTTRCIHVRLGEHQFLLPIASVRSTAFVAQSEVEIVDGREVLRVDARALPVLRLGRAFGLTADNDERRPIVVVGAGTQTWAIMIDAVIGQTEVVIQRLSWNLERVPGICGAAVLDGDQLIPLLDVHDLTNMSPSSSMAVPAQAETSAKTKRRVLVVDDSITSRTLLKNILSVAGYEVEVTVDGDVAFVRLQEESFDLVITDIEMPRLDGFELTKKIRATATMRDLPIIICTSLGNTEEKARGAAAGANAYVVKGSFEQDELLAAIGRFC